MAKSGEFVRQSLEPAAQFGVQTGHGRFGLDPRMVIRGETLWGILAGLKECIDRPTDAFKVRKLEFYLVIDAFIDQGHLPGQWAQPDEERIARDQSEQLQWPADRTVNRFVIALNNLQERGVQIAQCFAKRV